MNGFTLRHRDLVIGRLNGFGRLRFRNRDLRRLLYGDKPAARAEDRRRSAAVTRQIRLPRADGLIHKRPHTHRYVVSPNGHRAIAALLSALAADTKKLIEAA
jgi:hypothetical protein